MIKVEVKDKTLFINDIEVGSSKLECDAHLLANQLKASFAPFEKLLSEAQSKLNDL